MDDLDMDYSFLFATPSPGSRPATKMKPNTRFLRNIVSSANSHNAALLAKETAEARARLRRLDGRDSEEDDEDRQRRRDRRRSNHKRKDRHGSRDRERGRDGDDAERHHRKRRRSSRDNDDDDDEKEEDRRHRHSHRSHRRDRDRDREDRERKRRRRDYSDSDDYEDEEEDRDGRDHRHRHRGGSDGHHKSSSRTSRHHERNRSRSTDHDRRHNPRRSASRSRSPAETREGRDRRKVDGRSSHRGRSPLASRLDWKMKANKQQSSRRDEDEGRLKASTPSDDPSRRSESTDRSASYSDQSSDDDFGPRLASDDLLAKNKNGIRIKGRGALSGAGGSASMDRHFAETYDPRADVDELLKGLASASQSTNKPPFRKPADSVPTTEDARAEMARDRQKWLREGAERLRKAGFTDKEIAIWARGGKRGVTEAYRRRDRKPDQHQLQGSDGEDRGGDKDNKDNGIKWAAKGTAREWDRDKIAGEEGRPRPEWARK